MSWRSFSPRPVTSASDMPINPEPHASPVYPCPKTALLYTHQVGMRVLRLRYMLCAEATSSLCSNSTFTIVRPQYYPVGWVVWFKPRSPLRFFVLSSRRKSREKRCQKDTSLRRCSKTKDHFQTLNRKCCKAKILRSWSNLHVPRPKSKISRHIHDVAVPANSTVAQNQVSPQLLRSKNPEIGTPQNLKL